jgi:hypothetical protein
MLITRVLRFVSCLLLTAMLANPALAAVSALPCHQQQHPAEAVMEHHSGHDEALEVSNEVGVDDNSESSPEPSTKQTRCSACAACCLALALVAKSNECSGFVGQGVLQSVCLVLDSDSPIFSLYRPPKF